MGFGLDLHARSRKGSGWFRKAPDAREIGERVSRLVRRVVGEGVERAGWAKDRYRVELRLLPEGPPATLTVEPDATLVLRGETAPLGPGYHCELAARLGPLLDELDYAWTSAPELPTVQREMGEWLAAELRGGSRVVFGVPETRRFRIEAPLLSPLGPRDRAWCDRVLADPLAARDAFPWWERGPGRLSLSRALLAMWHDVAWREPLDKDERGCMLQVDEELRAVRKADPRLALPWDAWRELLAHLGIEDEEVEAKATGVATAIGYRRHDLDVELSGGWTLTLPGAMVSHWEDDGARYWATDGERAIEFTSFTTEGVETAEQLLAIAPEKYPVIARHHDGDHRGRAEAFDQDDVHVVIGLMACAPHVGILTCKAGDDAWALRLWRSLRQG